MPIACPSQIKYLHGHGSFVQILTVSCRLTGNTQLLGKGETIFSKTVALGKLSKQKWRPHVQNAWGVKIDPEEFLKKHKKEQEIGKWVGIQEELAEGTYNKEHVE